MGKHKKADRKSVVDGRGAGRKGLPDGNGKPSTDEPNTGASRSAIRTEAPSDAERGVADGLAAAGGGDAPAASDAAVSAAEDTQMARGGDRDASGGRIKTVQTGWDEALIVCRKCQKRMGAAYGSSRDEPFRKALRGVLKAGGRRGRVGMVQTGCFGVCPKRGVTLMRTSEPGKLVVVTPADLSALFPPR